MLYLSPVDNTISIHTVHPSPHFLGLRTRDSYRKGISVIHICFELQAYDKEKRVDGRRPDCGSLAIIHRQANQASKSGTMEPSKSRVGIKAALTGHCNPIEMFTLHLSKGNGWGRVGGEKKELPARI